MDHASQFDRVSGHYFGAGGLQPSVSTERAPVLDPATAQQIGELAHVTADEVEATVVAANAAQALWWKHSALHRSERLHEVAAAIEERRPEVAELLTRETGKPFKESMDEVAWAVTATRYYAELGRHSVGSVLGSAVAGQMHYTLKEPMGVVVIVLPAN